MFYTVFSTNLAPMMQWQSELLEYSWKRVQQEGLLIRLVATDDPANLPDHKYAHCVATKPCDVDPDTGDTYAIYNKPASLLEWLFRDKPEGTVLLVDPDCVFRAPVDRRVSPGKPVAQDWVDLKMVQPSVEHPFGFQGEFGFLNEHCARVDVSIAPVMIPKLIHTRDLRKICARWLQLCRLIREHYRDVDNNPVWESDMFAYLAACSEYGLEHERASIGICTNWRPEDAPDAPIIHYCNPIRTTDGECIFNKHLYRPWERLDTSLEPPFDHGRDLVKLIDEFIDELVGSAAGATPASRPVWHASVKEGRILDELLLEKTDDGTRLWLNGTAKTIWLLCDGKHTIDDICAIVGSEFQSDKNEILSDTLKIVDQLGATRFLAIR